MQTWPISNGDELQNLGDVWYTNIFLVKRMHHLMKEIYQVVGRSIIYFQVLQGWFRWSCDSYHHPEKEKTLKPNLASQNISIKL